MMLLVSIRAALMSATGLLLVAAPFAAHAQERGSGTVGEAAAGGGQLEEIVVTAQKRSENVQDVPVSITALSAARITAANITQVAELNRIDPALQIGQNSGAVQTFIRGIGSPVATAGVEASVPIYIDDVYFVRAATTYFDLANVERVEILKGPQGTLFGRNASGGLVSVYTRDPDAGSQISGKIGYGNYNTLNGQLYVGGPLSNTVAADISVSGRWQQDGWGTNLTTGGELSREKFVSVRSKLIWRPTATTSAKLIGYYATSQSDIGILQRPFPGTQAGAPPIAALYGFANPGYPASKPYTVVNFYDGVANDRNDLEAEGFGASIRIDQQLGFADLVSISAFRRSKESYFSEGDSSPFPFLRYRLDIVDRQLSQEFQIKSKAASDLKWILGAYYLKATQGFDPTTLTGDGPTASGLNSISLFGKQYIKSYALFGQATYPITDNTNITAGLRYTIDKVRGEGRSVLDIIGVGPVTTQLFDANNDFGGAAGVTIVNGVNPSHENTVKKVTWKGAIDHKFSDDVMGYMSVSRGFKAETFNTLPLDAAPLRPEVVDAYEAGLKTELFGRRARINVALFWNDIKNPQVQSSRGGLILLLNAGKAQTKGVEVDTEVVVTDGLNLRASASYLDARYKDFAAAPFYFYSVPGALAVRSVDASGNRIPFASKYKANLSLSYTKSVANLGDISVDVGGSYSSRFNWDADNVIKEKARVLVDASVAFKPVSLENVSLRLWAKNLTAEKYNIAYLAQASTSAYSSAPGAPRTYGFEVGFKF